VPWYNWLTGIKHGHSEVIKISLGDTCEIGRLGNGSALHVIELEKGCDHHLVVKQQLDWLSSWHWDVQSIDCFGSHQMNPPLNLLIPWVLSTK
jgi:hypothetical protein